MEAERLWRAEEGQASLANIQAVVLMSYVYVACLKCCRAQTPPNSLLVVQDAKISDSSRHQDQYLIERGLPNFSVLQQSLHGGFIS